MWFFRKIFPVLGGVCGAADDRLQQGRSDFGRPGSCSRHYARQRVGGLYRQDGPGADHRSDGGVCRGSYLLMDRRWQAGRFRTDLYGRLYRTGEVYITFRVETAAGKAEAELRVDVLELTPPVISLALPAEGSRFCRVSNIPSLPIFSIRTRRTSAADGSVPARSFLRR